MNFRTRKRTPWIGGLSALALLAAVDPAQSAIFVDVDMDPGTPGIQAVHVGGGAVTADLYLILTTAGDVVTDYSVSVRIDDSELIYSGSSSEPAVSGFPFTLDPAGVTDTVSFVPGFHQTASFDAGSFGAGGVTGPGTFLIGTMSFTVTSPSDDGLPDIIPGFHVFGIDGLLGSGAAGFGSGFVVPEPSSASLLLGLGGLLLLKRRRS